MELPKYISHIRRDADDKIVAYQSNEEHSRGVAELAERFASEFGMGHFGRIMGLLHDKGKEKTEFQNYIRYQNQLTEKKAYTHEGKAHAYVGGLLAKADLKAIFPLIANPIMGHHRGLYDYGDLESEAMREVPEDVSPIDTEEQPLLLPEWMNPRTLQPKDFHHVERMLFSCLVDADYLDTEHFMQPAQYQLREGKATLAALLPRLEAYLQGFGKPQTEVNCIRAEIQQYCRESAEDASGFYSLTVPTGGGKTLSSLLWAMIHAIRHNQKRIIIAIPYTSIIVQTAAILRNIFGAENVLEHHSNITIKDHDESATAIKLKLATENWDYPIIVTTNVQLIESMFSNKSSDCRKLHNIANSVLILDEVQTLPTDFLQPIVDTLCTYQRIFGVSVLFTTASQPVLQGNHQGTNPSVTLNGLKSIKEIVPAHANLHDRLRRVELDIDDSPRTYNEVADLLAQHDRVLCIVNTRRDAKEIFDRLPDEGIRIHLSRMMCPAHLSEKIQEMKDALANPGNQIVRVVSTQLIEAGVDIDFPVVYRQEAGLDSILQAAGRCNREGKLPLCTTHVFSLAAEHPLPKGFITQCNNAMKRTLEIISEPDWFSPSTMTCFFERLYRLCLTFDRNNMKKYLYTNKSPFESSLRKMQTAAQEFQLIDDSTTPIIVNWQNSLSLVEKLKSEGPSYALMRELSQYSVNLRQYNLDQMVAEGIVEEVLDGVYVAAGCNQYNTEVGLLTENQWLEETLII